MNQAHFHLRVKKLTLISLARNLRTCLGLTSYRASYIITPYSHESVFHGLAKPFLTFCCMMLISCLNLSSKNLLVVKEKFM